MPGADSELCISRLFHIEIKIKKHKDIGTFKLPSRSGDFYKQCKNNFLSVLCKYREREVDDKLKKRIRCSGYIR